MESNSKAKLKESALEVAKTIFCTNNTACSNCVACRKFDTGNYVDIILVDGFEKSIKKEQVLNIQSRFAYSAIEEKGIKVYTIHAIDNISLNAANSLLKFLRKC